MVASYMSDIRQTVRQASRSGKIEKSSVLVSKGVAPWLLVRFKKASKCFYYSFLPLKVHAVILNKFLGCMQ